MAEADYGELFGNCTWITLLVSFALRSASQGYTLIHAQGKNDYHGFYVSLQTLPRVYLTAACAQWNVFTISWSVKPSCDSDNEV